MPFANHPRRARKGGLILKIDVCLVTKNKVNTIKGMEFIPINNLIIETSTPLALARMRSIQKVETEWFAFIDDDVEIDENWFETLKAYTQGTKVGAIQGMLLVKGLGGKWDQALNSIGRYAHDIKLGNRGFTHNTLIRTEIVKDWIPPQNLSAYEDYVLTQYILRKGYRWINVPTISYHKKTWKKVWKNAIWATASRKELWPATKDNLIQILKNFISILRVVFSLNMNWRVKIYRTYFTIATTYGYIKSLQIRSRARL
jgi:glycosyltransferase involved in cell wall biosynthesis